METVKVTIEKKANGFVVKLSKVVIQFYDDEKEFIMERLDPRKIGQAILDFAEEEKNGS